MPFNNKLEVVNIKDGSVRFSTDNPNPVYNSGSVVWKNNIYVFGGALQSGGYSKKLYKFDTSTEQWSELTHMKHAMEAQGVVVEDKLYVIGGYNGSVYGKIDVYDFIKDKWSISIKLPKGISANSIVANGTDIFTLFDFTDQYYIGKFDTKAKTFKEIKQSGMIPRRHAGAEIVDDKIYIFGGNQSSAQKSCLNSLQVAVIR